MNDKPNNGTVSRNSQGGNTIAALPKRRNYFITNFNLDEPYDDEYDPTSHFVQELFPPGE